METKDMLEKIDAETKKMEGVIIEGLKKQEAGLETKADKAEFKKAEELLLKLEAEKKELEKRLSEVEVKFNRPEFKAGHDGARLATPGQQFIMSEEYQGARDRKAKGTEFVEVKSLFQKTELKQIPGATRGDLDADRAPVWSQRESEIIFEPGQREIRLFSLMASAPTQSNNIEYFKEVLGTGYARPGSQDKETHTKPQGSINFELQNAPVQTIAYWIPASRQVLSDAPQLQSYIDGRLTYAIMAEAERQILFGDGADGELLGIMNTPGVQTLAAPTGANTNLDQIRRAIARVRVNEYAATGIVLHPNDWAEIELLKDSDSRYIWVQVPNGGETRLWRVPVVESTVMEEGQYLLGAFGMGAKFWDRQTAAIRVSEHHEDYFTRNAVAILAELRGALAVYRPGAFCKGLLSSWSSS